MLLAIDVGNSLIKFGVYKNGRLKKRFTANSGPHVTAADLSAAFRTNSSAAIGSVIVASVVPKLESSIRQFAREYFGTEARFVTAEDELGFSRIDYKPLSSIGIDRLVAAAAAMRKYGAPIIVCDLGTATTIDLVDDDLAFRGGIIMPGPNTLTESLYLNASKLPRVSLAKPATVIGTSTSSAIQAGIFYGSLGAVESIVVLFAAELPEPPLVVATGGFSRFLAANSSAITRIDKTLILDGLQMLHDNRL